MKIYAFDMTGYETNSTVHLTNERDYSEEEYFDLCAKLYIDASEEIIKDITNEEYIPMYRCADILYTSIYQRLIHEYGFKNIEIYSSFWLDEYAAFDGEIENLKHTKAIDKIREKFQQRIRENKLNRIV